MDLNEQRAAAAFTKQSRVFDSLFADNSIIQYKRKRVRDKLEEYLLPSSHILELNSGTGEDAIWLAEKGHRVHATDLSTGTVSYTHLRAHETGRNLVCRLLLDKK